MLNLMISSVNNQTESRVVASNYIALILFLLSMALLFSLGCIRNPFQSQAYYGHSINIPAPDFHLTDLSGKQLGLENFAGEYVFLMFGYLNCSKTCHSQALVLDGLSHRIKDEGVRFVYVSMDPVRDTVARLESYFYSKNERLTVLKGESIKQMQSIANQYNAPFSINGSQAGDYEISHPGYIFLIDPDGKLAFVYASSIIDGGRLHDDLLRYKSFLERGNDHVG